MVRPTMPAGRYYVGDLCYVLHGDWNEVCDLTIDDKECLVKDGVFQLADGRKFAIFSTAFGDGLYNDYQGRSYSVDSGTIGCILISDLPSEKEQADLKSTIDRNHGQSILFKEEFQVYSFEGTINIGNVHIETDHLDDDEADVVDHIEETVD